MANPFDTLATDKRQNPFDALATRQSVNPFDAATQKLSTKTSAGLTQIATQAGVGERAKAIKPKGEDPNKIFSGGPIMDVLDTMNTIGYGVVGVLKGKTFREGVRTRESFTKGAKSAADFTVGLIADIVVDPLTWLGGLGLISKAVGKPIAKTIPKVGKSVSLAAQEGSKAAQVAKNAGDFLGKKFVYVYGQPVFRKMERAFKAGSYAQSKLVNDLIKPLNDAGLGKVASVFKKNKVADLIRRSPAELQKMVKGGALSQDQYRAVTAAWEQVDTYMKEAQRLKMVSEETRDAVGAYVANLRGNKISLVGWNSLVKRKAIDPIEKIAMGTIMDAGTVTEVTLLRQAAIVERGRFLEKITKTFGETAEQVGYKRVGEGFGLLTNKWVPEVIHDHITTAYKMDRTFGQLMTAGFKYGKVILNPATWVRNFFSNKILMNFQADVPYWRMPDLMKTVSKDMHLEKTGVTSEVLDLARRNGIGKGTMVSEEMGALMGFASEQGLKGKLGRVAKGIGGGYQKMEEFDKLMAFYYNHITKKLPADVAAQKAKDALFEYGEVGPAILKLRQTLFGFPFITFATKATKATAKTILEHPERIGRIGKLKTAIENLGNQGRLKAERANEPLYIKNGLFIRLPSEDDKGRSVYFDMTYLLPFGDLVTGAIFAKDRPTTSRLEAMMGSTPVFSALTELAQNKDFFGNEIYPKQGTGGEQGGAIMKYLLKTYSPSALEEAIDITFDEDSREYLGALGLLPFRWGKSIKAGAEAGGTSQRTFPQEVARSMFGIKMTPIDLENERAKRENEYRQMLIEYLRSELGEDGDFAVFEIPYVPKESSLRK